MFIIQSMLANTEHVGFITSTQACAACDHPWVSYRGFVELMRVGDTGRLSFRKLETKSQKEESGGGQSNGRWL